MKLCTNISSLGILLVADENKCLINPEHPDYKRILVREVAPLSYDPRMFAKQHQPPAGNEYHRPFRSQGSVVLN